VLEEQFALGTQFQLHSFLSLNETHTGNTTVTAAALTGSLSRQVVGQTRNTYEGIQDTCQATTHKQTQGEPFF
jgi:hypothetical protein